MNIFYTKKIRIGLFYLLVCQIVFSQEVAREQLEIGNFALPSSQQPGPLIGFGQNMLDKQDLQFFTFVDYLSGHNKEYVQIIPTILYGFTQDLSLFVQLPIAAKFQENKNITRGVEDVLIQLEYSFYNRSTPTQINQISLVSNITLSFDTQTKAIRRGFGVTNLFFGFTASHMGTDWYPFASLGTILSLPDSSKTKGGNQILYECGLSKNICYKENKYIFNWMIELDGFYKEKDKKCGVIDLNSGGNTILLGPSLWFSTQHFSLQAGISGVVFEHLNGIQNKNTYYITVDCGWKF